MIYAPLAIYLRAWPGLITLIGSGAAQRYYEGTLGQKAEAGAARIPGVVIRSIDIPDRQQVYCGTVGTVRASVGIDCYDSGARGAWLLAAAVRGALLDFRGMMGGTLKVHICTLDLETELDDPDPGLYRVRQNWAVWFLE